MSKENIKPVAVRCSDCAYGILPIENHMMGCRHSRYKVHTGKRICMLYMAREDTSHSGAREK